jgi:arylformamidase
MSGRRIYDISPPISPETPVWPGDTPFSNRRILALADGHSVNLETIETTTHLGAHVDAPHHFADDGKTIGEMELGPYLGPCRLIEALSKERVTAGDLRGRVAGAERLLIRTCRTPARNPFEEGFASVDPEAAALLGEEGVKLVGLDTPSVDDLDSKELPTHNTLDRHGIAILEGLVLEGIPEGEYELIALPLKLFGLDASPVRAVLREL